MRLTIDRRINGCFNLTQGVKRIKNWFDYIALMRFNLLQINTNHEMRKEENHKIMCVFLIEINSIFAYG
jgi:uncharacterized protein involved in tolerance to divalent cations